MAELKIRRVGKVGLIRPGRGRSPLRPYAGEGAHVGAPQQGAPRQLDLMPEGLREVARRIGRKRAQAVWRLKRRGVMGSLPELCTYGWLERRKIPFEFQSGQMGGRMRAGGAVVDFIVSGLAADGLYVWRVQGDYWHQGAEVERKDEVQKTRLLRLRIGGLPVVAVVDLWENAVYDRYPEVFEKAEMGMELGRC